MKFTLLLIAFIVLMIKHIHTILHYERVIRELNTFILSLIRAEINEKDNYKDNH